MNENIDLTKILKDCPKGWKFYSSVYGEVEFIECDNLYQIVVAKENKYYYFTPQGKFVFERIPYNRGECCLFPSKEMHDWSKFTAPWYKKETSTIDSIEKQGEQTTSKINERAWLYLVLDVLTWKDGIGQYLDDTRVQELAKNIRKSCITTQTQKTMNKNLLIKLNQSLRLVIGLLLIFLIVVICCAS